MIHWASLSMEFLLVWHHCHPCDIDVLQYRADIRIRLHEKKVFVRGWEMVPKVYRFQGVGLAILYSVHRLNSMCPVLIYRPGHGVTISHTIHSLLLVLALLCLFDGWRRWYTGWAEAFCTIGCLYISLPFQPGYLPICVLTLCSVFACCGHRSASKHYC